MYHAKISKINPYYPQDYHKSSAMHGKHILNPISGYLINTASKNTIFGTSNNLGLIR